MFWGSEARVRNPGHQTRGVGWTSLLSSLLAQARGPLAEKSQANARDRGKPSILSYAQGNHLSATNIEHSCLRSYLK